MPTLLLVKKSQLLLEKLGDDAILVQCPFNKITLFYNSVKNIEILQLVLFCRFLCTAAVYLIGGVILNCTGGATGLELIPNLDFWKSLPGLIAVSCK